MKFIAILSLFVIFMSCTNTEAPEAEINPDYVISVQLKVTGMTCGGCENTIQTKLSELPGVDSVKASHIDSSTLVLFDSTLLSSDKILAAFEKLPYEAYMQN
jgi:copper chaperone